MLLKVQLKIVIVIKIRKRTLHKIFTNNSILIIQSRIMIL